MQRNRHEQVEVELAPVVGGELASDPSTSPALNSVTSSISFSARSPAEALRRDRLRERAVERRRVDELDLVPNAALPEVPVREERELEGGDRALDRHVDEIHDDASAVERVESSLELFGSFGRVEGERRARSSPGPAGPPSPPEAGERPSQPRARRTAERFRRRGGPRRARSTRTRPRSRGRRFRPEIDACAAERFPRPERDRKERRADRVGTRGGRRGRRRGSRPRPGRSDDAGGWRSSCHRFRRRGSRSASSSRTSSCPTTGSPRAARSGTARTRKEPADNYSVDWLRSCPHRRSDRPRMAETPSGESMRETRGGAG